MSRFYPGQQVKKVRGEFNVGMTGTVTEVLDGEWIRVRANEPGIYHLPGATVGFKAPAGAVGLTLGSNWEPIVPPGMEPIADALALWLPEGVAA